MSSFTATFINKETGTKHKVFCWDDYFGRHRYGYVVDYNDTSLSNGIWPTEPTVLTEDEFQQLYKREDTNND